MSERNCPDCLLVSDDTMGGRGRCSQCHGTGYQQNLREAEPEDIAGASRRCRACTGSGTCATCAGRGWIDD